MSQFVVPSHQSQTKDFRQTFRQIYLWPHQLQKRMTRDSNFLLQEKRERSPQGNLKTVRANFLTNTPYVSMVDTDLEKALSILSAKLKTIVCKKK